MLFSFLFLFQIKPSFCQITVKNEGQLFIQDNQLVHINGNLKNASSSFSNRGDLRLTGNFWNTADVTNSGNGILRFIGDQPQFLLLDQALDVYNFEIDNPSGLTLSGDYDLGIFSDLDFTDGIIFTHKSSLVSFQAGANYFDASDFSHIDGPASKTGMTDFIFPIGKGNQLRPSGISNLTEPTTFLSEYFNFAYTDLSVDNTLNQISDIEYWEVNRLFGNSDAVVLLDYIHDQSGFNNQDDVSIAYFDNPWTKIESTLTASSPAFFMSNNSLSKFGFFTFAEDLLESAILFEAIQKTDCSVELQLIVLSGTRAQQFEVEISFDSIAFTTIAIVEGDSVAANAPKFYRYFDNNLYEEDRLYYRIKVIRSGGSPYYTPTIGVKNNCIFKDCTIFPNPVLSKNDLQLRMFSEEEQILYIKIVDELGRVLLAQPLTILPGNNDYTIPTKQLRLASSSYFLQLTKNKSLKFVVIND